MTLNESVSKASLYTMLFIWVLSLALLILGVPAVWALSPAWGASALGTLCAVGSVIING